MFQRLIERLNVIVASLEQIAIRRVSIRIDIFEENGAAFLETSFHYS